MVHDLPSFKHIDAKSIEDAVYWLRKYGEKARVIAGGTELLSLMKDSVEGPKLKVPEVLVNIKPIAEINQITFDKEAGLVIGAAVTLDRLNAHGLIEKDFSALSQAARQVGTTQIRNMGTIGGNICQRPQCLYFRHPEFICNKKGGIKCYAIEEEHGRSIDLSIFGEHPQCQVACPAHVNVPGYVALIKQGKFKEALELVRNDLPFPAVCGRVCPAPCEKECQRTEVDDSVSIRALKRFIADRELKGERKQPSPIPRTHKERVAIIGSGPAGLTAAYELVRMGYPVTVFESLPEPGGMLRVGIPEYRLPKRILDIEINYIKDLGVEIKTNMPIGRHLTLTGLFKEYKAIFIGFGAQISEKLGVEGEELRGVVCALDYLREVNLGKKTMLGNRVAVIGGGDVAIDAARTALRLGTKEVSVVYRRSRMEMPAYREEVEQAEKEGVRLHFLAMPTKVIGENGKVAGLECTRMKLGEPDESGRRQPIPIKDSEYIMELDAVIFAVGQRPDVSLLPKSIEVSRKGTILVDPVTLETSQPGVFAGGDAVLGPATIIEAIAAGKRGAVSIDRYLRGEDLKVGRKEEITRVEEGTKSYQWIAEKSRIQMPLIPPDQRTRNFEEIELGFAEDLAMIEAGRCLSCGCYATNTSDMAPALIALNAKARTSKRTIPIEEFFTPFASPTVLHTDEILTEIQVPTPEANTKSTYLKFKVRKAVDFAVVSVAVMITVEGGICKEARIVLGAVAPTPIRATKAEAAINGKVINATTAEEAAIAAVADATPVATNAYKIEIIKALLKRAIRDLSINRQMENIDSTTQC